MFYLNTQTQTHGRTHRHATRQHPRWQCHPSHLEPGAGLTSQDRGEGIRKAVASALKELAPSGVSRIQGPPGRKGGGATRPCATRLLYFVFFIFPSGKLRSISLLTWKSSHKLHPRVK